jgi:hypothetical protein
MPAHFVLELDTEAPDLDWELPFALDGQDARGRVRPSEPAVLGATYTAATVQLTELGGGLFELFVPNVHAGRLTVTAVDDVGNQASYLTDLLGGRPGGIEGAGGSARELGATDTAREMEGTGRSVGKADARGSASKRAG